ncbi:hypothetical protein GCM10020331_083210 [Ectobacillus funiculus]
MRPILLVGVGVAIFQQVIGTNTIIYYTPTILIDSGIGASSAIAGTIGIGIINVLFTIIGTVLIDRLGRKMLMLIGNIGMSLALGVLGVSTLFFSGSELVTIRLFRFIYGSVFSELGNGCLGCPC